MTTRKTVPTPGLSRSEVLMLVAFSLSMAFTVGGSAVALMSSPTNPFVWVLLVAGIGALAVTVRLMVRNLLPRRR